MRVSNTFIDGFVSGAVVALSLAGVAIILGGAARRVLARAPEPRKTVAPREASLPLPFAKADAEPMHAGEWRLESERLDAPPRSQRW